jgi:hypothetical protein
MSSEWGEVTLGDFVRLQRGHDLTASEQRVGAIPVMGSAGQNGTHNVAKAQGHQRMLSGRIIPASTSPIFWVTTRGLRTMR